jgi:flagellar hook-length control protein FliK
MMTGSASEMLNQNMEIGDFTVVITSHASAYRQRGREAENRNKNKDSAKDHDDDKDDESCSANWSGKKMRSASSAGSLRTLGVE